MIMPSLRDRLNNKGLTLVEVIIASLVVAVVAGGTMMAFIASANMTGPYSGNVTSPNSVQGSQDLSTLAEANDLAQQTVDSLRNEVQMVGATDSPVLQSKTPGQWYCGAAVPLAGSGSKLTGSPVRRYQVFKADCDGDGTTGDCYGLQSQVCWNNQVCTCL